MSEGIEERLFGKGLLGAKTPPAKSSLHQRFFLPPFSVWNTREGWWQHRREMWLSFGIKSEEGRKDALTFNIPLKLKDGRTGRLIDSQTSIFDPVLTEVVYNLFASEGGVVVDPFAGGSVRGIVASLLGLRYWGGELRGEQVEANRRQAVPECCGQYKPRWVQGDSYKTLPTAPFADFIFSCPPYGNLEVYSDDPADISNKEYPVFLGRYREIIEQATRKLRNDRFACFVVSNFRDRATGRMHDFVGDTIRAFEDAGLVFYNDIILVNSVGTGGMRTNGTFVRGHRKLVKMHQNVLVFVKGNEEVAAALATRPSETFQSVK